MKDTGTRTDQETEMALEYISLVFLNLDDTPYRNRDTTKSN